MLKLEQVQQHIPQQIQSTLNWTAAITGLVSFLTTWVPIVVGLLSGVWVCVQLYIAWKTKPWRRK